MKRLLGTLAAAVLIIAACGGGGGASAGPGSPGAAGTVVTVAGAFRGDEATRFEESFKAFEDANGVDVQYSGSAQFETDINTRVEAGDPPDIAALPQPGLMKRFAAGGKLIGLPDDIIAAIDANYAPDWKTYGTGDDGKVYGVFHRVNVKSLVFYPKKAWDAASHQAPATWTDMTALMDKIAADGTAPWCIAMESGTATGWVATDWVEDIMLRTAGPDVYDQWVAHEIPFNDPQVKRAVEEMGKIWLDEKYVYGGTTQILTVPFGEATAQMFEDPPQCWLHRQGSFITGFFPDEVKADLDGTVGLFPLPSIEESFGTPALGGGDQFVMFEDRPEVRAFLKYLTTGASGATWAKAGGAIFPHKDQDTSLYPTALEKAQADLLLNAESFRFDGSDLMPAAVGAGSFWEGMVNYVNGTSVDEVLDQIEASWPA